MKKMLSRIDAFLTEAKSLPEDVYTDKEFRLHLNGSKEEKAHVLEKVNARYETAASLKRKIIAFIGAHYPSDDQWSSIFLSITFHTKGYVTNTFNIHTN